MKSHELYSYLEQEFGQALKAENRKDGRAYYWREIRRGPNSTRLIRISETQTGDIHEIKLACSSREQGKDMFIPLAATSAQVAASLHGELERLLNDSSRMLLQSSY